MAGGSEYNILSICAGIGGLDLAVGLAVRNARTVCYIEREVQAAAVLAARMEDETLHAAPVWSDLSTFNGKPWRGLVDLIISGDPCQPNSVAGKRLGAQDDRFLIDQLIRVIDEVRPGRVFRENVTGNADGQLQALIPALEKLGYRVAAGIFSAAEVGASHKRERLFIMADAGHRRGRDKRAIEKGENPQGQRASGAGAADRPSCELGHAEHTGLSAPAQPGSFGKASDKYAQGAETSQQSARTGERRYGEAVASGGANEELGNAKSINDRGLPEREAPQHARFNVSGGDVANANSPGLQGQQPGGGCTQGRQEPHGLAGLPSRAGLPVFAPGPSDERWGQIVAFNPFFAPTLSDVDVASIAVAQENAAMDKAHKHQATKSLFCRMADGLASRTDRLRASGNGVCSMAGAIAWLSLAAHFEQGDLNDKI